MRLQVKVTASVLNIRSIASKSGKDVGNLVRGTVVIVNQNVAGWYKLEDGRGWISSKYVSLVKNLDTSKGTTTTNTKTDPKTNAVSNTQASQGLDKKIEQMLIDDVQNRQKLNASTRLFGGPFQFTKYTDFRLSSDAYDLGRKYMESIVSESPIVYFMPGRPNYLPNLSEEQRKGLTNYFTGKDAGKDNQGFLNAILNSKEVRYFDFLSDYANYIRYVNMLCRFCAIYMGVGDRTAPGTTTKYKYFDWGNYRYEKNYVQKKETTESVFSGAKLVRDMYEAMFGNYRYSQFYVEPNMSFSESMSNNTMQSKMESAFESAEGIIKELSFLTNTMAIQGAGQMQETFADGMNDIAQKMLKNTNENFFTRLLGMSSTVLSGSNIIFPELWGDSAYNKSYNVTMNFVSPYGEKESIYLHVIVPLMHILALSLPRQTTANSYTSPFLVKVVSKGWFSCELGIIDSLSIEKGGQGSWTINGLPSEIKVTVGIKDLYSSLMVTPNSRADLFIQNQGLIEFLATTVGADITKPHFATKVEAIMAVLLNSVGDIPANLAREVIQSIRNSTEKIFKF